MAAAEVESVDFEESVKNELALMQKRMFALKLIAGKVSTGISAPAVSIAKGTTPPPSQESPKKDAKAAAAVETEIKDKDTDANSDKKEGSEVAQQPDGQALLVAARTGIQPIASDMMSDATRAAVAEGGDVRKALKKCIASFGGATVGQGAKALHLLAGPPCRSYRQLITLEDFAEIAKDINDAQRNDTLVALKNKWKPYKEALTDLLSMSKSAESR